MRKQVKLTQDPIVMIVRGENIHRTVNESSEKTDKLDLLLGLRMGLFSSSSGNP